MMQLINGITPLFEISFSHFKGGVFLFTHTDIVMYNR